MTDISNKLHITQNSKKNIGNNSGKNEEMFEAFKNLPENPEKIKKQAEKIRKQKEKEEKEKIKNQQLEKENYKIDKWMSLKEKLKNGWKKEENVPAYINRVRKKITVLKKTIEWGEKDAFVWEYLDDGGIPKNIVGEQIFNWNAVLNLWLQTRLPSYEQIETIRWDKEKHQKFLENNFQKNWPVHEGGENSFPGYWGPILETFFDISGVVCCWLSDGKDIEINNECIKRGSGSDITYGFSLRLLKD